MINNKKLQWTGSIFILRWVESLLIQNSVSTYKIRQVCILTVHICKLAKRILEQKTMVHILSTSLQHIHFNYRQVHVLKLDERQTISRAYFQTSKKSIKSRRRHKSFLPLRINIIFNFLDLKSLEVILLNLKIILAKNPERFYKKCAIFGQ